MPVAAVVQALHQGNNRPFVVVAHGGKAHGIARQQHQGRLPRAEGRLVNAGKPKQHHAVDIAPLQHTEVLFHHLRRELAFHHDRIVTLLVKHREHGLDGQIFRQRVQTGHDDRHHFVALATHGARRAGRGEAVLIHHRLNAFTGALADAAFVVQHPRHGGFPHAA
ncbi:hypothetical protein D3C75_797200 [compost metagenome]